MPGRLLIWDPHMTNRLLLKAQLSQDFFDISSTSDEKEFYHHLRLGMPDSILMSYTAERAVGFQNLAKLRSGNTQPYVPIIFLHSGDDPRIWDQSHDCLVDDVLSYNAERWLKTTRINLIIRGKENFNALATRQHTIAEMGFAEETVSFPPLQTHAVTLDFTRAISIFNSGFLYDLTTLIGRDFPAIEVRHTKPDPQSCGSRVDVFVVDETTLGRENAYASVCALRKADPKASILYCCAPNAAQSALKALELGACDFTIGTPSLPELACKMRRAIWLRQAAVNAEKSLSNHLQSALLDPLTGLYNRRYALQHLTRLLSLNNEPGQSTTVMVIDLDRFKSINDTYGHLSGDAVLKQTAERLKNNLREPDLVARLGGEEFLVVLTETSLATVKEVAERLRKEISASPFQTESGKDIHVSASIGVSATKKHWSSANALIDSADLALYRSKDNGRNQVTFCNKAA